MPSGFQASKEIEEPEGKPAHEALRVLSGLQARVAKEDLWDLKE